MPLVKRVLFIFVSLIFFCTTKTYAACEVRSSTLYLTPDTTNTIEISLRNTTDSDIVWVSIPINFSQNFTNIETEIQDSGWSAIFGGEANVFSGGTILVGDTTRFTIRGLAGPDAEYFSWVWQTSPTSYGFPAEDCDSLDFSITSSPPELTPTPAPLPQISQVVASVGSTTATITWRTDVDSDGVLNYGTTTAYGNSSTGGTSVQSHSISLTGLTPSTLYHFQLQNTNDNGTTSSTDNTFTTSAAGVTTTVTNTITTTTTATVTVTQTLSDTSSPVISLKTDFTKPFLESPTITGTSTDGGTVNAGLASIEYSMDGGKNWLPVDDISGLGKKSATFEFTPGRLDDGNYLIKMRARDISGNTGLSKLYTLIIDRLPPQVGGSLFALGPMILKPNSQGTIYSIAGLPLKVVLSAVGGPIKMDLTYNSEKFPLIKNIESGLWSNLINIKSSGTFPIKINSLDGAENATERTLGTVVSLPPGKVVDENSKPISKARIKIFTFEKTINDFTLWEAEAFMQTNPQETDENGEYRQFLPAGKYYLKIEAAGKRKLRTEIFELTENTPLTQNFSMTNSPFWGRWFSKTIPISTNLSQVDSFTSPLIGQTIPYFDLSISSQSFSNTSILGKPTIISFITSWEPQTSDQLLALDKFKLENENVNVFAVTVQESITKTDIFKKTGNYTIPILADADGILVLPLSLHSLPTHLIVDRKGIIKEVVNGYTNESNLLNLLLK